MASELFADVYSICHLRLRRESDGAWPSGYGYEASDRRHRAICAAIVRAWQRIGGKGARQLDSIPRDPYRHEVRSPARAAR